VCGSGTHDVPKVLRINSNHFIIKYGPIFRADIHAKSTWKDCYICVVALLADKSFFSYADLYFEAEACLCGKSILLSAVSAINISTKQVLRDSFFYVAAFL
jgi:hypothetical protein